jgi:NhaP-type Na+/H+ or K+/H+ antiporter
MHDQLIQICLLTTFSIGSLWLGWRLKIPSIVFFLLSGFLLGPFLDLVHPDHLFGDLLPSFVSIAVGIILFEGSLTLDLKELTKARRSIRHFVIIGAPVSWILTSLCAHYVAGLSWPVSITFGALLIVTGPTVIMPLLKNAKLQNKTGSILKWEGIVNDPIGAILAVLSYEYFTKIHGKEISVEGFFITTAITLVAICVASFFVAYAIRYVLNRNLIPEYLKSPFVLSFVIIFFVLCNELLHESGLIAVTILGVALANIGVHSIDELKKFKESISLMLVSGLFIILTAKIDPEILLNIDLRQITFIILLLMAIRPLTVLMASLGTNMTWREILYTGWIAPRGIVCAAIAGIMGPQLLDAGYGDGANILPLAFAIVLITVFLHGFTAKPLGRLLGLSYDEGDSMIIVGASPWTLQLAETLRSVKIRVLLTDTNWHTLKNARLNDIPTYYGEILSEDTEHNLEFNQYNAIFAATYNIPYNSLICNKFTHDFGRANTYQILAQEKIETERKKITGTLTGRYFANPEFNFWDYNRLFDSGWRFKATLVNENFNQAEIEDSIHDEEMMIIGRIKKTNNKVSFHAYEIDDFSNGDVIILFGQGEDIKDV